jgi:hypothetical protein
MQNGIPVGLRSSPSFGLSRSGQLTAIIQSLFWDGSQGWWYDDNDTTTLFQDSAGTTPVTAVEQFVGLQLDKSRGLVLGPELVTNGNFSQGSTGWTETGTGEWIIGDGKAYCTAGTGDGKLLQTVFATNKWYQVTFDLEYTSGTLQVQNDGYFNIVQFTSGSTSGRKTAIFASGAGTVLSFRQVNFIGSIDNISVRELPGNHRYAPASGNRPIWSKRVNLLTKTEQFDDAAWSIVATRNAVTPNAAVAPDGSLNADRFYTIAGAVAGEQYVRQSFSATVAMTNSIYVKKDNWRYVLLRCASASQNIFDLDTGTFTFVNDTSVSVTPFANGWFRISASGTPAGSFFASVGIAPNGTTISWTTPIPDTGIFIWGADLRPANQATGLLPLYQRVNTSTDYDTNGFPGYLKADGVDDFLQTNSIDFSATDKITLCAGLRKLSDAVAGMITELSASTALNNGVFQLQTQTSGGYFFRSKGTSASDAGPSTGYNAPITDLLTGIGNISGDQSILRINGTQVASSATDQGTGNYGNYPVYFFQRNGPPAANRFNGYEYGNVAVGKLLTADQTVALETYMNGLTKAY